MPELPEVEVVRRGLAAWIVGRSIAEVEVRGARTLRRYPGTDADFAARLRGRTVRSAERRGKFLWLPLSADEALAVHLGMSGQLLVGDDTAARETHLRVRVGFDDDGPDLRFVDQRTFGWVSVEPLVEGEAARTVAAPAARIAPDPLERGFDAAAVARRMRRSARPVKAALLDQGLVSGIGNIYADEALWRERRHWATPCQRLRQREAVGLLGAAAEVMSEALDEGGTSFDSLYVNVNGDSGYFDRSLNAYGQAGRPCVRCGRPIRREKFANRSSFSCPQCQRRSPRRRATPGSAVRE